MVKFAHVSAWLKIEKRKKNKIQIQYIAPCIDLDFEKYTKKNQNTEILTLAAAVVAAFEAKVHRCRRCCGIHNGGT